MDLFLNTLKQKATVWLLAIAIGLTIISFSIGVIVSEHLANSSFVRHLLTLFNLDGERNIPTWYQTLLLCFNGLILLSIGYYRKVMKLDSVYYWLFLGIVFLGLSIDEFVGLHEITITPLRETLNTSGALYFAWVIPAAGFVGLLGLMYLPFLFKLPPNVRYLLVVAGFVYILGAMGMEVLGGDYVSKLVSEDAERGMGYVVLVNIEETLETFGLVILFYGLMSYTSFQLKTEQSTVSRRSNSTLLVESAQTVSGTGLAAGIADSGRPFPQSGGVLPDSLQQ